jgi:tRNA A-37 threonylcarbamoyl transferase component Bud32/LysM repeat protein
VESSESEQAPLGDLQLKGLGARYRVIKKLGSGAMGDVYLADDTKLQRQIAIKSIRAERCSSEKMLQRIKRECLLHAKIGAHLNIVTLFDLIDQDDEIYLIMEYVEGETLRDALRRHEKLGTRFPKNDSLQVAIQCLSALKHTHEHGVIHRDIKPANVILTHDKFGAIQAKVVDFGIARLEEDDPDVATLTAPGERSPGTPLYMSPEQIDAATYGKVGPLSDIYSMGIMLYHMLAGAPPFAGALTDIFNGHLNFKPKPILLESGEALDPQLMTIVEQAMQKKPRERYQSTVDFTLELFAQLERAKPAGTRGMKRDAVPTPSVDTDPLPHGGLLKKRGLIAVSALLVIVVGVFVFNGLRGGSDTTTVDQAISVVETVATTQLKAPEEISTDGTGSTPTLNAKKILAETTTAVVATAAGGEVVLESPTQETDTTSALDVTGDDHIAVNTVGVVTENMGESYQEAAVSQILESEETSASELTVGEAEHPVATPNGEVESTVSPAENFKESPTDTSLEVLEHSAVLEEAPNDGDGGVEGAASVSASTDKPIYIVQSGDFISKIAQQHGLNVVDLARWNLLENPNAIEIGQELYLYERPNLPEVVINWDTPVAQTEDKDPAVGEGGKSPALEEPVQEEGTESGFFGRVKNRFKTWSRKEEME